MQLRTGKDEAAQDISLEKWKKLIRSQFKKPVTQMAKGRREEMKNCLDLGGYNAQSNILILAD